MRIDPMSRGLEEEEEEGMREGPEYCSFQSLAVATSGVIFIGHAIGGSTVVVPGIDVHIIDEDGWSFSEAKAATRRLAQLLVSTV